MTIETRVKLGDDISTYVAENGTDMLANWGLKTNSDTVKHMKSISHMQPILTKMGIQTFCINQPWNIDSLADAIEFHKEIIKVVMDEQVLIAILYDHDKAMTHDALIDLGYSREPSLDSKSFTAYMQNTITNLNIPASDRHHDILSARMPLIDNIGLAELGIKHILASSLTGHLQVYLYLNGHEVTSKQHTLSQENIAALMADNPHHGFPLLINEHYEGNKLISRVLMLESILETVNSTFASNEYYQESELQYLINTTAMSNR
jgi:hypothetical protein